jgi:hypothetical protein
MNPDDNASPPLDGIALGKRLNHMLSELRNSETTDTVIRTDTDDDPDMVATIDVDGVVESDTDVVGGLYCSWWHMGVEDDWWKFTYMEFSEELLEYEEGELSFEEHGDLLRYFCEWGREANDFVDGETYFVTATDDGIDVEPFNPPREAAKPLTRAISDTLLPEIIHQRHGD